MDLLILELLELLLEGRLLLDLRILLGLWILWDLRNLLELLLPVLLELLLVLSQ